MELLILNFLLPKITICNRFLYQLQLTFAKVIYNYNYTVHPSTARVPITVLVSVPLW